MSDRPIFGPEQLSIEDTPGVHVSKCKGKGCVEGWVRQNGVRMTCLKCEGTGRHFAWRSEVVTKWNPGAAE